MNNAYNRESDALVSEINALRSQAYHLEKKLDVLHALECKHL